MLIHMKDVTNDLCLEPNIMLIHMKDVTNDLCLEPNDENYWYNRNVNSTDVSF